MLPPFPGSHAHTDSATMETSTLSQEDGKELKDMSKEAKQTAPADPDDKQNRYTWDVCLVYRVGDHDKEIEVRKPLTGTGGWRHAVLAALARGVWRMRPCSRTLVAPCACPLRA
jgi:hypothetical protein